MFIKEDKESASKNTFSVSETQLHNYKNSRPLFQSGFDI